MSLGTKPTFQVGGTEIDPTPPIINFSGATYAQSGEVGTITMTGDISSVVAGAGLTGGGASGAVTLDVGAGNGITVNANDVALNLAYSPTWTGNHTHAPTAATSGAPTALTVTGAADTAQTASTEKPLVNINGARTVTWATGAIATQREVVIQAPTYAFAGASTVTNAATLAITGQPQAGANATLTSSNALWVQSGPARFDGSVLLGDSSADNIETKGTLAIFNGAGTFKSTVTTDATADRAQAIADAAGKVPIVTSGTGIIRSGTLTLVAGTATVADTSVTANTRVFYTPTTYTPGGGAGDESVQYVTTAKNVGASFVVEARKIAGVINANDVSVLDYIAIG